MRRPSWQFLPLLLLLLGSWLQLSLAHDLLGDEGEIHSINIDRDDHYGQAEGAGGERDEGARAVESALSIFSRIEPTKPSLVRLPKNKGFLGSTVHYAKKAFVLLFMNGPTHPELISRSTTTSEPKLSTSLVRAVSLLEDAWENHQNQDAIWLLAELNFHGNYTHPRNYTAAFEHYHALAALSGNASAQHMLGFMYATGIGGVTELDQARALLYHTFAAEQGDTRAQMTVAFRHHAGIGTPRDCESAVKYYRQVATKAVRYYKSGPPGGHVLIKHAYRLADEEGGVYGEGASVSSAGANAKMGGPTSDAYADIADVLEYLDFQARKGDLRASFSLAKFYYDGARGLAADMPRAKEEFMRIARMYWLSSGKTVSDAPALVEKLAPRAAGYLGRMFLRGEGTRQSFDIAKIWLKRGIEYGDALSQYSMGVMYMQGLGVPKDAIRAASYLGSAADNDMAVAQTDLGVLFLDQGDISTARSYFELAIRSGHIEAYFYLAEMAHLGLGRERSCHVAASYYKIAAEKAELVSASFVEANEAYETNDLPKALVGYMMAAEQGWENAQANVAWLLDRTTPTWSLPSLLARVIPRITSSPPSSDSSPPPLSTLALTYYTRSARQNNLDSLLKAGDHHLLGHGAISSSSSSPENAAACYTAAAESMRSAQALWNLGWMHERGLGVEQDFHLAKRYYDLALETNREAYLPVKLSLGLLRVRSWWNGVRGGTVRGIQDEPSFDGDDVAGENGGRSSSSRRRSGGRGFWEWVAEFLDNDRRMWEDGGVQDQRRDDPAGVGREVDDWDHRHLDLEAALQGREAEQQQQQQQRERGQRATADEVGGEYFVDPGEEGGFEELGILLLAGVLAGLIWWRQQRVQRANQERDRVARQDGGQDGQDGHGGEQRRDPIFPAPDDPDFAPWNVPGGIGH